MPKLSGFDVVELAGSAARYIFVTAYDQYALKAFDIHAIDYLLKPFSQQRLDAALAHARASIGAAAQVGLTAMLHDTAQGSKPLQRVLIRDGAKVHVIAVEQIDYIEAQDDYVHISAGDKAWLKHQRLAELESALDPARFVRIHRSFIVNIASVSRIEQGKDSHCAILNDGRRLPVSRSGYARFRSLG